MSTDNPYASPGFFSQPEVVKDRPPFTSRILATISCNTDYVIEGLQRYRRQDRERRFLLVFRVLALIIVIPTVPILFWKGEIFPALLIAVAAIFLFFVHHVQDWLARRSFQKDPFKDDIVTVEFTESGFHALSPKQDVKFQWCVFTKVVHFQDGFLLFRGPRVAHWIPVSSIPDPTQVQELERLLAATVAEHKVVKQVALPGAAPPLIS